MLIGPIHATGTPARTRRGIPSGVATIDAMERRSFRAGVCIGRADGCGAGGDTVCGGGWHGGAQRLRRCSVSELGCIHPPSALRCVFQLGMFHQCHTIVI